jgi:PKD repeat protein
MKRTLTLLLILFALVVNAQIVATVSGHVMLAGTTLPVPNHAIQISLMSNDSTGDGISTTMLTDSEGFYSFSGTVEGNEGFLQVNTEICNGQSQGEVVPVSANSPNIFVFDFYVCQTNGCQADFSYYQTGDTEFQFTNQSSGENLSYFWSFGDDTFSYEENPLKSYSYTGIFEVTLNILSSDSICNSSSTQYLLVGDTIIENCQAAFYSIPSPNSFEIAFFDISIGNPTQWIWEFGDGITSNEQNPVHQYSMTGEYIVTLSIQNADGSCNSTVSQVILIGGQTGCFAWFDAVTDPTTGLTVGFIDRSMGNITQWFWDFGDGSTSTEYAPVHTYAQAGFYQVCLTISSNDSTCWDMSCQTVTVGQATECLAQFTYYPDSTENQTGIQFIDLSYGNLTSWSWSFGDGTGSTEQNPVHVFTTDGVYNVCLTVGGENCQSSWCEQVTVGETEPGCFNYFTYVTAGNSVQFEGFHSSDIPASYQWDFGDGVTSLGNPMTHTYANPGVYFVNLTSWDDNQCTAISGQNIVIGDSIAFNQVYGQVFEGNWPMNNGFVMIFSIESDTNYFPYFNVAQVDSMGVYVFPFVPNGAFNLFAIPTDGNGYLPTYFESTLFWEEATAVVPGETSNPYNISLVSASGPLNPGNGSIFGQINQAGMRADFIGHVIVFLTNADHQPLGFTEVASDGSFQFTGLAYGTYYIKAELAGVSSEYLRADISEGNSEMLMNLTFSGNSFLGTAENNPETLTGNIFPNPVIETASVEISSKTAATCNVMLFDLSGRMILSQVYATTIGTTSINIPVNTLQSGMYMMKIQYSNGTSISRKFIKE